MRRLYSIVIAFVAPAALAGVMWRGLRDRAYWQHPGERLGFGAWCKTAPLWLHAVSLGEMTAAAPLIRALLARHPNLPMLLTSATPAGRARALALFPQLDVRYLPYDTVGSVRRFLGRIRPRFAIIMETELWPNLFAGCRARGIPVLLANARLSNRSVTRYKRFGKLVQEIFWGAVQIAAQSVEDAQRFASIGARPGALHVVGNIKFDLQVDPAVIERGMQFRTAIGAQRPVWIAGSTHAGEEQLILDAHRQVTAVHADALLLLAPRHRDRFDAVAELLERNNVAYRRRSHEEEGGVPTSGVVTSDESTQVVLVDTLGELLSMYAAADVAFVGGSLVPIGGHNLLEPAALGKPVLTGPSQANAYDIAHLLLGSGAALQVNDSTALARAVLQMFDDPAQALRMGAIGQSLIATQRGSVDRLLALIEPSLAADHPSAND